MLGDSLEQESAGGVGHAGMLGTGGVPEYWARSARRSGVPEGVEVSELKGRGEPEWMESGLDGEDMSES